MEAYYFIKYSELSIEYQRMVNSIKKLIDSNIDNVVKNHQYTHPFDMECKMLREMKGD